MLVQCSRRSSSNHKIIVSICWWLPKLPICWSSKLLSYNLHLAVASITVANFQKYSSVTVPCPVDLSRVWIKVPLQNRVIFQSPEIFSNIENWRLLSSNIENWQLFSPTSRTIFQRWKYRQSPVTSRHYQSMFFQQPNIASRQYQLSIDVFFSNRISPVTSSI